MVTLKPWYRIPESSVTDGNPEIEEYAGRGELHVAYTHRDRVLSFLLRNNLQASENRSGYELDWSLPFSKRIKGLVQYYNGWRARSITTCAHGVLVSVLITDWL
jgi:phospholipase A1